MKKDELILYGALALAVGLLGFSFLSLSKPKPALQFDAGGSLANSPQNFQYYQQQAQQAGSECGSLTDEANVQHLSHHPDQFKDCLRQVAPAFLVKATGKTYEQIFG